MLVRQDAAIQLHHGGLEEMQESGVQVVGEGAQKGAYMEMVVEGHSRRYWSLATLRRNFSSKEEKEEQKYLDPMNVSTSLYYSCSLFGRSRFHIHRLHVLAGHK